MPGIVTTISYTVEYQSAGSWFQIPANQVERVSSSLETTGNLENGVAFGDNSQVQGSIEVARSLWSVLTDQMPVRVTYTVGAATARAFVGLIASRRRTLTRCEIELEGIASKIASTRFYSNALYRRPAATKTTASSIEDPANVAYNAGLINRIMWEAGGRPVEQSGSYPTAIFSYGCDQALFAPEWSWVAGEDGWQEALRLARACGGQLFVDTLGVVRFRSALSFANSAPTYTFTESVYRECSERYAAGQLATKVICQFIPRFGQALQEVADDASPRLLQRNGSLTVVLEPQWPCSSFDTPSNQLRPEAVVAVFGDGTKAPQGGAGYTHTITFAAQRVALSFQNQTARPIIIHRIMLKGTPIAPGEPGSITSGSGTTEKTIEDNPYVQSKSHAQRLADLVLSFYGTVRPFREIEGCPWDPNRLIGEVVGLTCQDFGLTNSPHVITAIRNDDTGATAGYTLVYVGDLIKESDFFLIGSTDYSGQSRKLGF